MNKTKSGFLKLFILSATIFMIPAQASFLREWAVESYMYFRSKQGRTQRSQALIKILEDLLTSHAIACKIDGYDTIYELKKQLSNPKITLTDEVTIIINIISNNIYQRAYNRALSESKKISGTIHKYKIHAFAEKEKNSFLKISKQPRAWERHRIAGLGDAHFYPAQYYFLPQKEELESLFRLFSDDAIQKRFIDTQKQSCKKDESLETA